MAPYSMALPVGTLILQQTQLVDNGRRHQTLEISSRLYWSNKL